MANIYFVFNFEDVQRAECLLNEMRQYNASGDSDIQ